MNKNFLKKVLGEYYIDVNVETRKEHYVQTIINFINQDLFKAIVKKEFLPQPLSKNQSYGIKSKHIFMKGKNSTLCNLIDKYDFSFRYYVNTDTIVLLVSTKYSNLNPISTRFSLSTLKDFYECFVYNVLSPKLYIREQKEIEKTLQHFKDIPKNLYFHVTNNVSYVRLEQITYDKNSNQFVIRKKIISKGLSDMTHNSYNEYVIGYNNLQKRLKDYDFNKLIDIESVINEYYDNKMQVVIENKQNCLRIINNN